MAIVRLCTSATEAASCSPSDHDSNVRMFVAGADSDLLQDLYAIARRYKHYSYYTSHDRPIHRLCSRSIGLDGPHSMLILQLPIVIMRLL